MLSPFWENVGIATAVAFGCLLMILAFAARLKGMAMELAAKSYILYFQKTNNIYV